MTITFDHVRTRKEAPPLEAASPENAGARSGERVFIIAPVGQDAGAMGALLEAEGFETTMCPNPREFSEELVAEAGLLLMTEEALELPYASRLMKCLEAQEPWSELPLIILTSGHESSVVKLLDLAAAAAGSITLLERPLSTRTLVRSVEVAIRQRRRQYQVRDLIGRLGKAEEELRQHAARLEETVAERTTRLNETVQDLEAFSYSIAHDMRAPLRAMVGFSDLLTEDYAPRLDDRGQTYVRRIASSATRLDQLIHDVLNYSRVIRGDIPLSAVDTGKLLQDIVESYPNLRTARIELVAPLPLVEGNIGALTQVFSNLLGNAVKFVPVGTQPRVRVWAETGKEVRRGVRLWFEDNGIGIEKTMQNRIFQMFQRLNRSELYEGTGIGLAVVRKAVERMGGKVGVESELGEGCRFWVEMKNSSEQPSSLSSA